MILPRKDEFEKIIRENKEMNEKLKEKIILLYDNVKEISNDDINQYDILKEILEEIFNPYKLNQEPSMPLSFFQSALGKLVVTVLNDSNEKYYSIIDLIELTKTPDRPDGFSKQYLSQEIKNGRLRAEKENGRYIVTEYEVNRYLKDKGIKE